MPAVGYSGLCTIDAVSFPFTSESIYEGTIPIIGKDLVTGNASPISWADGELTYTGNITFPLFDVGTIYATVQTLVSAAARGTTKAIKINNGFDAFTYTALATTLTISASPGGNVTFSTDIVSEGRSSTTLTTTFTSATTAATANQRPIPWWKTSLTTVPTALTAADLQDWSVTISNNTIGELVSDGTTRYKKNIQGQLTATGRLTVINPVTVANLVNGENMIITIAGASNRTISLTKTVWTSYGIPVPGPNQRIKQTLEFTAVGDGTSLAAVLG